MMAPGTSIKLDMLRNGEAKTLTLTLGQMPNEQQANADASKQSRPPACRTSVSRFAPASEVAGSGGKGVVVTGVDPNGIAADHGIKTGDVILDVGGKAVGNVGDVRKALTDAQDARQARRADAGEDRQRHEVRRDAAAQRITWTTPAGRATFS